jgi:hypothetical protein
MGGIHIVCTFMYFVSTSKHTQFSPYFQFPISCAVFPEIFILLWPWQTTRLNNQRDFKSSVMMLLYKNRFSTSQVNVLPTDSFRRKRSNIMKVTNNDVRRNMIDFMLSGDSHKGFDISGFSRLKTNIYFGGNNLPPTSGLKNNLLVYSFA